MANRRTPPPNLIRGTNNTGNATLSAGNSPSRLLINTNALRNNLTTRNLYTPNRIYPITDKRQAQEVLNAINGIASIIAPFKSYNINNTVYGRLLGIPTPLTEISLSLLGRQFALNSGSHIAQQNFPVIKVANLFDGAKNTKLFTRNISMKITKREASTNFQQFLNAVIYYYPGKDYPFKPTSTNADFVRNTGTGQLTFLYTAMNQNIYKEGFSTSYNDVILDQYSDIAEIPMTTRSTIIGSKESPLNKYGSYYNFFNTNPYSSLKLNDITSDSIRIANGDMVYAMNNPQSGTNPTQEYAPSQDFVQFNFGTGIKKQDYPINDIANDWINAGDEFGDDQNNKLIWGRDGISAAAGDNINKLLGTFNNANDQVNSTDGRNTKYNAYSGLLEYTRNLLNASEGAVVDITRKAFQKGKNIIGFNGSALWVANQSKYARNSGIVDKTGVRQHSMLDQYDRFAKTIRFMGNEVYGGNPNSVIYKTVLPRIHPTTPVDAFGVPNNHNLMFSIENLAVRVISNGEGVGIIDDEFGSQIPICEVGQFNGRLMWFPPYNMEVNESTAAKFESTVMVGRNEPIYNYMNSERSATLSFTLLIDYPPNLKDLQYQGANKHREIAEFFAFGGDAYNPEPTIDNIQAKIIKLRIEIEKITGPTTTAEPDAPGWNTKLSFPNDFPKEADVNTAVDTMYKTYQYEIEPGCREANGKLPNANGINKEIYVVTGTTGKSENQTLKLNVPLYDSFGVSQYTMKDEKSVLNQQLKEIYENVDNRPYYDVIIIGGASKLYTEQNPNDIQQEKAYNEKLGLRRARAAKHLVDLRIKALFGQLPENLGINVKFNGDGSTGSDLAKQDNATFAAIDEQDTKEERYATINIVRNNVPIIPKTTPLSPEDIRTVQQLNIDIQALEKTLSKQKSNNVSQCIFNEKGKDTAAILKGFQAVEGNYYQPVFHSQTPEDFHRRLTFLQQCMRQGAAKRYDAVDEKGILRAKNSVFGRQPICILRIGDFFFTKIIIENLTIDYSETTWDMNPEGFGMQPMLAKVTLQMKIIGGQSLVGPIDALQNAVTFNYYANSNFTNKGMYSRPAEEANNQKSYMDGILTTERTRLTAEYNKKQKALEAMQVSQSTTLNYE